MTEAAIKWLSLIKESQTWRPKTVTIIFYAFWKYLKQLVCKKKIFPVNDILDKEGWSNVETFWFFYGKPIDKKWQVFKAVLELID